MDDKLKVFWNLDVLVKMCRSKSDGPSLRIEETEIEEKINSYTQEIDEIKTISEDDIYDTSAEMADRNIEIITKRQLQKLKNDLKDKNKELNNLKEKEANLYEQSALLRDNKNSQEKYIVSMQERISETINSEIIDRYNSLIAETSEKVSLLKEELEEQNTSYNDIQQSILILSEEIASIENQIDKKKKLLAETQANLENKDNYVDKTKKDKNNKRIVDLESKIQKLNNRLGALRNDPKYLETKIKDVINNKENISEAKKYLVNLVNQVIEVPYINVAADNNLEEELLRATQARDSFANEIDQKSYNILEANTPEKVRIDFLAKRIIKWQEELEDLRAKIELVDKDKQFDYEKKNILLSNMIREMKSDLKEYERAYEEAPDINIGAKASLKAALDEKKEDIIEAEKIATAFKKDEAEDISAATRTLKYECEQLHSNIYHAEQEIASIKNRLMSKKSGLIDITTKNKDKDTLKELAQIVIDIKHRRGFPETPVEIVQRLEEELQISLIEDININIVNQSSKLEPKDYEKYLSPEEDEIVEEVVISDPEEPIYERRGIRVVDEAEITIPENINVEIEESQASKELQEAIKEVTSNEEADESEEQSIIEKQPEEIVEDTLADDTDNLEMPEKKEESNISEITDEIEEKHLEQSEDNQEVQQNEVTLTSEITEEPINEEVNLIEEENIKEAEEKNEQVSEVKEEIMESTDDIPVEEIQEEALDISSIIDEVKNDQPEAVITEDADLSINSIFSNQKNSTDGSNNDNIVSSENLANELDEYLNNLDNN